MAEPLTKSHVLSELRAARRDWERLLVDTGAGQLMSARVAREWPVKAVVYHATRYADMFVQALEAHLQGSPPPPEVLARPDIDERNTEHFQQSEKRTLGEVAAESRQTFDRLIELVQLHSDSFLSEPQQFEGVGEPIIIGNNLLHVCNHYRAHAADIRARTDSDSVTS